MNKEKAVIAYIGRGCMAHCLSPYRVVSMIYLSDWKSYLNRGRTITDATWYLSNRMPTFTPAKCGLLAEPYELTAEDKAAIDHVIRETVKLDQPEFVRLVLSTYPAMVAKSFTKLDLPALAASYQGLQQAA